MRTRENTNVEREEDIDYRVQVSYTVPLEVVVDLRKGRVDRVVIIDEGSELDRERGARQECLLRPIPAEIAERAIEIAETRDWPRWERGF